MNLFAWVGLAVVLVGTAQFDATAKLAAAFAYLILVAVVLADGKQAAQAVQDLINGKTGTTDTTTTTDKTTNSKIPFFK